MLKTKLALSVLGIATALSASTAFADFDRGDFGRGGFGGPVRYRCQMAQQNLANAQAGLNQAILILSQVQNICGGAIACIITAQNAYNQAVVAQQNAQREVNFACRPHFPPRDGGGWGRGGGGWGRPFPPGGGRPFPGQPGGGFPGGGFKGGPDIPDGGQGNFPPVVIGQ